ncbi:porin family protein [Paraflavitalea sp. CAU 1676]|uniref:porin family protein n=1 Tax=Paraflavitalea sp. CAU 1676 TaxID=3032598 RepID=UPI0023DA66E7|nr:porin family protein [Paraflavitalea sp. CAU 1676]MDF2190814.1 porin family protein [Paraflavitalea sp. CAU 1676]
MKKVIVLAALACCSVGFIQAQTAPGIKGGLNLTDVSNFNGSNRVSGHVGLFLHHSLNSRWCIQPELLYSGQGQKYQTGEGERTLALSYIQVPVMIQYYPVKQLYFEFGPQLSFLTSAKVKGGGNDVEVDGGYRKADVGVNLGVGVAATQQIGFYARYGAGLTDITKNGNTSNMNRVGQLGMFVRLH